MWCASKSAQDTFGSGQQQCAKQQHNRGSLIPVQGTHDMIWLGRAHKLFDSNIIKREFLKGIEVARMQLFIDI